MRQVGQELCREAGQKLCRLTAPLKLGLERVPQVAHVVSPSMPIDGPIEASTIWRSSPPTQPLRRCPSTAPLKQPVSTFLYYRKSRPLRRCPSTAPLKRAHRRDARPPARRVALRRCPSTAPLK